MTTFLVTGGAGFVGANLAIRLKQGREADRVIALDNLVRRGSELNLPRLHHAGVTFLHGDVRQAADLALEQKLDFVIDCAAEPSAAAGYGSSPGYVLGTNLIGTLNTLEVARRHAAGFVFLSSSRVYPYTTINDLQYIESESRFELADNPTVAGVSNAGFSESFPLPGLRTLYGATKLASELIVSEYLAIYSLRGVINRCGVIAGPWQMGKVDQGFVTHWVARHLFGGHLAYKGFGGQGKQVRDVVHVEDLYRLLERQFDCLDTISGQTFNVGGGVSTSVSLRELTKMCGELTGKPRTFGDSENAGPGDIRWYASDCRKVKASTGWQPTFSLEAIVDETLTWLTDNRRMLEPLFGTF